MVRTTSKRFPTFPAARPRPLRPEGAPERPAGPGADDLPVRPPAPAGPRREGRPPVFLTGFFGSGM